MRLPSKNTAILGYESNYTLFVQFFRIFAIAALPAQLLHVLGFSFPILVSYSWLFKNHMQIQSVTLSKPYPPKL